MFFSKQMKVTLTALLIIVNSLFSQSVKVTRVLESNLFKLNNGQKVRLADLYMPVFSYKTGDLGEIGFTIENWSKSHIAGRSFNIKYKRMLQDSTYLVYLYRSYLSGDEEDIALHYLKNGFAVCINNSEMAQKFNYLKYESEARDSRRGIWALVPSDHFNQIDSSYYDVIAYNNKKEPEINKQVFAAKLRVIDLLESEKYDSLDLFIKHCDSLSFPPDKWLTGSERFLLELFKGNLDFLINVSNYKNFLKIQDSMLLTTRQFNYYIIYDGIALDLVVDTSNTAKPKVNVLNYLLLNFRNRIASLKEKNPGYDYVWDFLDFFYNTNLDTWKEYNIKATEYFLKYPDSPLIDYVRYTFIWKTEPLKTGMKCGIGYGVFGYDVNTKRLFLPRGNMSIWVDMYFSGVNIAYTMGRGYALHTKSDIMASDKLIQSGTSIYQRTESLSAGYLFRVNPEFDITPYTGLVYTGTEDGDNKLPSLWGWQAGLKADLYLGSRGETELFIAGDYMLRAEAGVIFNDYHKIRPDLGGHSIYFSVGILFSVMRHKYYYTFNNERF